MKYWEAVDKAVKFVDTLLLKKEESNKKKEDRAKSFKNSGHNDRYHWSSANRRGRTF